MKSNNFPFILSLILLFQLLSCRDSTSSALSDALTFYVSFDNGTTADFALGDNNIYTANGSYFDSKRILEDIQVGMNIPDHQIVNGRGKFGDAFEFKYEKGKQVLFYKSQDNIAYNPANWSGSISFWLSVDPSKELGWYTDPVQITDSNFNDASIWVDFTDDTPPGFRLGVFGDKNEWTLDTLNSPVMEEFDRRTVSIKSPSFSRKSWTHVLITFDGLGTPQSLASLYIDGKKQGVIEGIDDPFTWKYAESNIFLGLGFNGLMDELSIFNKPLTDDEVMELLQLKGGIQSIL